MNEVNDDAVEELEQQEQEKAINVQPEDESVKGRARKFSTILKRKQKPEPEMPFAVQIKHQMETYAADQSSIRGKMLEDLETEHRIEEHRVYREQLEREGSKRRQQRRERRESAHQQQYLASLEQKIAPSEHDGRNTSRTILPSIDSGETATQLMWVKSSASRHCARPRWLPREVRSSIAASLRANVSTELMEECEQMHKSLQQSRSRRLRTVATAPDAEMFQLQRRDRIFCSDSTANRNLTRPETVP